MCKQSVYMRPYYCLFQLAEVNHQPRIKLSEDIDKVTMPGRKDAYRLYGTDGNALVDLLQKPDEPPVTKGKRVLCRHPYQVGPNNIWKK